MKRNIYFLAIPAAYGLVSALVFLYYNNVPIYPNFLILFITMIISCHFFNTKKRLSQGRIFVCSLLSGILATIFSIPVTTGMVAMCRPDVGVAQFLPTAIGYGFRGLIQCFMIFSIASIIYILLRDRLFSKV